jgi:multidrug efflux pump subunit AcrA (membrane-fusion protein)
VTTYPVVIAVPQPTPTLAAGSRASASILLDTADGVVTLPNSAITTTSATTGVVTLVSGSTTTRTPVTLGVIGATRTQIVKGVKVGQQVLLADPTQPLPTSSITNTRGFGGGGGFGGAGGFGGGGARRFVSGGGG